MNLELSKEKEFFRDTSLITSPLVIWAKSLKFGYDRETNIKLKKTKWENKEVELETSIIEARASTAIWKKTEIRLDDILIKHQIVTNILIIINKDILEKNCEKIY